MAHSGRNMCFDVPHPSLIAYNTAGMMHLKITYRRNGSRWTGYFIVPAVWSAISSDDPIQELYRVNMMPLWKTRSGGVQTVTIGLLET